MDVHFEDVGGGKVSGFDDCVWPIEIGIHANLEKWEMMGSALNRRLKFFCTIHMEISIQQ